ncbi:homoserine kinase [Cellulosimicrobium arenosum]|uniref:Homoserine kinase n=1 Tax=Cellulosimicrobium arenosum TaxID=2708133 RepID=A0A927J1B5_9MICO|nr:homoserine kinase [Cellulosimicrobium arenosum]MBD8080084.1 homoserine kinase [Cellulosimicrobium arenosum]
MQLGADHVQVRVPATSANLGPGFDALGIALASYDVLDVRALASDEVVVDVEGEGAADVPRDETHLVVRALRAALEVAGAPQTGLHLSCVNRIPHGRGLGSSAAAVVAGIVAARALVADPSVLDDDATLRLASNLEGHPDNAAPAILGGATVAWGAGGAGARAVRLELHPDLCLTALVPSARLATSHARGVLPDRVPHADAAFNAGRSALLVEALSRRPDLLLDATEDRLHQGYRSDVMPTTYELVQSLRAEGVAATVSGAGPTVLVLCEAADADRVRAAAGALVGGISDWAVHPMAVDEHGVTARRVQEGSSR